MQPEVISLDSIRVFCIDAYLQTRDFTLLHTVTGTHAFRVLQPFQSDIESALRWHWQAMLVSFLSTGLILDGTQYSVIEMLPWDQCFARAIASNDDHRIKLTYTCWSEFTEYGDERYAQAASVVNA